MNWDQNIRSVLQLELAHPRGGYNDVFPARCWDWWADKKEDGHRNSLQIGGKVNWMVGRNRKDKLKGVNEAGDFMVHRLPSWLEKTFPDFSGTLFDGEYLWPGHGAAEISHAETVGKTHELAYVVFDCLFSPEHGDMRKRTYRDRLAEVHRLVKNLNHPNVKVVETYMDLTMEAVQGFWKKGWEGLVFKNPDSLYDEGSPNAWQKLKAEVPIDAFVVGVEEGKSGGSPKRGIKPQPNGTATTFEMAMFKAKKIMKVGTMANLDDEAQKEGLKNFNKYEARVAEATVSGFDGKRFRWMRFKRWREDKSPKDCEFSEQVGGQG